MMTDDLLMKLHKYFWMNTMVKLFIMPQVEAYWVPCLKALVHILVAIVPDNKASQTIHDCLGLYTSMQAMYLCRNNIFKRFVPTSFTKSYKDPYRILDPLILCCTNI